MTHIIKRLVIRDKNQLYRLIEPKDELSLNPIFIPFLDSMNDYYYGCRCDEVKFNTISNQEYNNLNNDSVIHILKNFFNCEVEFV